MRPFPFGSLPRVAREDVALLRACARRLPLGAPAEAARALGELLGVVPGIGTMPLGIVPSGAMAASLGDPLVGIVLQHPEGPARARVAIELDPRLAACVIDRALGGSGGADVPDPKAPLGEVERGVLAFVAARAVARAEMRPWRVMSVVTAPSAMAFALGDAGAVVWSVDVALGDDRGVARAWVPEAAIASVDDGARRTAAHLGGLSVTLVADGARGLLARDELDALREGDVVVLDETWLTAVTPALAGKLVLHALGARRTTFACTLEARGIVVTAIEQGHDTDVKRGRMTERDEGVTDRAVERVGDASVEVTVELARFEMSLEELAALRAGEVVETGRALGERVVLRAGGRAIASGELVDVDGEIGVRLLGIGG